MPRPLTAAKKLWTVFCTLAMCITVGMTTNHIAMADSATQNSNIIASLKYMSELNKLRQSRRTPLTAQQIIEAQNADNSANMRSGQVAEDAADGSPVPELNVNWDLMSWAQKRADALAERASVNQSQPISHDDMYVGAPSWTSKYNLGERVQTIKAEHIGLALKPCSSDTLKRDKAIIIQFNLGIANCPLQLVATDKGMAIISPK